MKKSVITISRCSNGRDRNNFWRITVKTEAESISSLKGQQSKIQDKRSECKS